MLHPKTLDSWRIMTGAFLILIDANSSQNVEHTCTKYDSILLVSMTNTSGEDATIATHRIPSLQSRQVAMHDESVRKVLKIHDSLTSAIFSTPNIKRTLDVAPFSWLHHCPRVVSKSPRRLILVICSCGKFSITHLQSSSFYSLQLRFSTWSRLKRQKRISCSTPLNLPWIRMNEHKHTHAHTHTHEKSVEIKEE